ncbi:hypothetical protein SEUCBS139899_001674 [Sporothrix eucalyptigena]|uniref:Pali-domain-containing protein n=1 Tax=Sporothrix eucalyptigena TaxID=1812306 RepID=A0ABP0ASN6_9PEZI
MARTGFFHHIGSFLLFASTILLLVVTISSPVVDDISLLKVQLSNATSEHNSAITFGTFGYCTINTASGHNACTGKHIGYNPAAFVSSLDDSTSFSTASEDSTKALTRVMILHPIATGIAFIAFLLAVGAGVIGSFLGAFVSLITFIITVVVLITDFVLFHIIKDHVNDSNSGAKATYGVAIWLLLVAAICSLLGTLIVFFSCCSARMHRSRNVSSGKVDPAYVSAPRRRRFF